MLAFSGYTGLNKILSVPALRNVACDFSWQLAEIDLFPLIISLIDTTMRCHFWLLSLVAVVVCLLYYY